MKNDILTTPTDKLLSPLQPILEEGTEKKNGNQNNYFDMNLLNQNEENKKEEPIMKDLIAENFVLLTTIGKGAFGEVSLSYDLRENIEVAIKQEKKINNKISQLKIESKVYQKLLNIQLGQDISGLKIISQETILGVPKFYGMGELPDTYYLIMEFLGPNLNNLFNYCGTKKFTISTVCLIALQMLNRIEYIHKHHYLHRDIKPENFCIGTEEKTNVIYLMDFGLSKRYKNSKNFQHIPYREGRSLIGTARYVSINTHLGIEPSRRDDIESIGYVLIYFLKGNLPWQGLKDGEQKYIRIMEKKLQIPTEVLCYGLPDEFVHYLNYTKNLKFEERPDYDYLRNLFVKLLGTCINLYNLTRDFLKFDWCFDAPLNTIWQKYERKKNKGSIIYENNDGNITPGEEKNINYDDRKNNEKDKGGIIDSLLESSKSHSDENLSYYNVNLGKKNNNEEKEISCDSSSLASEKINNNNNEDNDSDNTLKYDFNGLESSEEKKFKDYIEGFKKEEEIDNVLKIIIGEKTFEDEIKDDDEEILKKNKSEVIKNTVRNSKYLDEKDMEKAFELSKKKLEKMNEQDLMKLDGINGFQKSDDINSTENKKENKNDLEKKNKNNNIIKINNSVKLNDILNKNMINKENKTQRSINNNNIIPQRSKFSIFKTSSVEHSVLNKLLNKTSSTKGNNEIKSENKHSFESEIIPKMNNLELSQNKKSKILEVSSSEELQMKVGKETLIKISTDSLNNNYIIVGELGSGSYGTVKKVKHKKLGEYRAMKIINKKSESSQNEVDILRKISHPNIVNIFEIYEDSKKYYIMMEICEGGELFEAISQQGSFSEGDCANIMKSLLSAVNYLHGKNIVHRDLKPENIMLTKNLQKMKNKKYEIKLIDFGTAKQFEPHQKLNKFIGTSYYIAPEVLKENYNEKCDIWSCGVILYILLCGYPPFNGNSNVDIYHNIQNNPPYFNGEEWKDITKEAIDLIKCMLNKIPNKRFSAEQCLNHKWFKLLNSKDKNDEKSVEKLGKKLQLKVINKMADFVKENRLKQAVLQFISTQFNLKKEEDDLKALFSEFDIKQKGQITKEVFYEKLSQLYGENDGREICDRIFERLDLDGSGEISYDEFLSAMIDGKKVITDDRLAKAFKMFDKDGNGKLSIDEIIEVFGGEQSYWVKVIEDVDLNKDGEVDYEEFKLMMGNLNNDMVKK
jgi:calcium-dependent protein kinase